MIYLPVQSFSGFKIAGYGISPSQFSIHISRLMTFARVKKVFLRVNNRIPSKASYTMPMTGLLD